MSRLRLVPDDIFTLYEYERMSLDAAAPPEGDEHVHEFETQFVCRCGEFEVGAE